MSKFDKIFAARQEPPAKAPKTKASKAKGAKKVPPTAKAKKPAASPAPRTTPEAKRRGRPPAKRSNPNYLGFTTYIHRDVHRKVKMRLLENAEDQELSELVEALLRAWLDKK
jgi:hypothetical protein